jgi:hypothetical protein
MPLEFSYDSFKGNAMKRIVLLWWYFLHESDVEKCKTTRTFECKQKEGNAKSPGKISGDFIEQPATR